MWNAPEGADGLGPSAWSAHGKAFPLYFKSYPSVCRAPVLLAVECITILHQYPSWIHCFLLLKLHNLLFHAKFRNNEFKKTVVYLKTKDCMNTV